MVSPPLTTQAAARPVRREGRGTIDGERPQAERRRAGGGGQMHQARIITDGEGASLEAGDDLGEGQIAAEVDRVGKRLQQWFPPRSRSLAPGPPKITALAPGKAPSARR